MLETAIVYDIETLPNVFTLTAETLYGDTLATWEISEYRDDRQALITWFNYLQSMQIFMIGFNNVFFDYPVIHYIYRNPNCSVQDIYNKAQDVIKGDRFGSTIWANDRFAPQVDVFKINHFDNKAKTTSLKALQINMRSQTVVDSPLPFDQPASRLDIETKLIPYNVHDVQETKKFAFYCMDAIKFRMGLIDQFGVDALNFNDTKIGAKILEQRLGDDVCYTRVPRWDGDTVGRKSPRQTPRYRIALNEIIFPYIQFNNPEFNRVLNWMKQQVLTPEDLEDPEATIKTKGVFKDVVAHVGGIEFEFGTGGIHGSVKNQRIFATPEWLIRDIDVEGLYPNIAIVNRLAPAHLGDAFITEYSKLPVERKKHAKGTVENASFKLGSNGTYGNSNNKFSVFYDPQFTMTITINGQLMLCMLAEWLMAVPTFQIIQINTDGITYRIHRDYEPQAAAICKQWEAHTCLKLESADYGRMFIRDVNSYIAEPLMKPGQNEPPKYKNKGAYWFPEPGPGYAKSISTASPPAWHKDLSNIVSIRAAHAAMTLGIESEVYIRAHTDPFDFMLRAKVDKASRLMLGGVQVQSTTRYYVARQGAPLMKISPPPKGAKIGDYKRKQKISDHEYNSILATIPAGTWDERIHMKNKNTYSMNETGIEAGWNVAECNDARNFSFDNLNYDYYVGEAKKLIIS